MARRNRMLAYAIPVVLLVAALAIALSMYPPGAGNQPSTSTAGGQGTQSAPGPSPPPAGVPAEPSVSISMTNSPQSAESGSPFQVSWRIDGPATAISNTAIYYSYGPYPGNFGTSETPASSGYGNVAQSSAVNMTIPGTFMAGITPAGEGMLYFRAYALVGGKNYWTPEMSVAVSAAPSPPAAQPPGTIQYVVQADDSGFYVNGSPIYSISVAQGTPVSIDLSVLTQNVYHGGLQFRGGGYDTGPVAPGSSATVSFNASNSFTLTSYWPNTNTAKKTLQVLVSIALPPGSGYSGMPGSGSTGGY